MQPKNQFWKVVAQETKNFAYKNKTLFFVDFVKNSRHLQKLCGPSGERTRTFVVWGASFAIKYYF